MNRPHISILLVAESGGFRGYVMDMLAGSEFSVWEAHDSAAARKYLTSPKLAVDILLTDAFNPPEVGWELAVEAATLRPGLKILMMSSRYLDAVQTHGRYVHQGLCLMGAEFILKPFSGSDLLAQLRTLWESGPRVRLESLSGSGWRNQIGRRAGGS